MCVRYVLSDVRTEQMCRPAVPSHLTREGTAELTDTRPDYVVLTMLLGTDDTRKRYKKTIQENDTRRPDKQEARRHQILEFCLHGTDVPPRPRSILWS